MGITPVFHVAPIFPIPRDQPNFFFLPIFPWSKACLSFPASLLSRGALTSQTRTPHAQPLSFPFPSLFFLFVSPLGRLILRRGGGLCGGFPVPLLLLLFLMRGGAGGYFASG